MKHAFQFLPTHSPEFMKFDYVAELTMDDARVLRPSEAGLDVDFSGISLTGLSLFDSRMATYGGTAFKMRGTIVPAPTKVAPSKWILSENFDWTVFDVRELRKVYVLLRKIKSAVEDAMILSVPLTPCYGLVQTFDVRVDVPKEITNFENFRRSIVLRDRETR